MVIQRISRGMVPFLIFVAFLSWGLSQEPFLMRFFSFFQIRYNAGLLRITSGKGRGHYCASRLAINSAFVGLLSAALIFLIIATGFMACTDARDRKKARLEFAEKPKLGAGGDMRSSITKKMFGGQRAPWGGGS
eukprot:jgi/Bigna1/139497/aug1.50_g14205